MIYLQFSKANSKLAKLQKLTGKKVYSFDTLSGGVNCPFAKECNARVIYTENGFRIQDGEHTKFRCFSASQEVIFPALRNMRLQNSGIRDVAFRDVSEAVDTIIYQFPKDCEILRWHVSGDISSLNYLDMMIQVANKLPSVEFYAYTKSIPFWIKRKDVIPANLRLTASFGGWRDDLISAHNLPYAKVIFNESEANDMPIDYTDELAYIGGQKFCLMLHGPQKSKSLAAQAWQRIKQSGGGYSRQSSNTI
jgi:hypothetical protein